MFCTFYVWHVGYVEIFRYPKQEKAAKTILATANFAVESTVTVKNRKHQQPTTNNQPGNVMETMDVDDNKECNDDNAILENAIKHRILNGMSGVVLQKRKKPSGNRSITNNKIKLGDVNPPQ